MKFKNILFVSILTLLSSFLCAEVVQVEVYQLPQDRFERVVLEMEIAKAIPVRPEILDYIGDSRIISIDYVYTSFAPNGYNQASLNELRIQELRNLLPQSMDKRVKWREVIQTRCQDHGCASELLHGFVIRYAPQSTFNFTRIPKQFYSVNSSKAISIKADQGTIIQFPAHAFEDEYGNPVEGEISVELREALKMEDIVKGGLNTMTTHGGILESGGMIEIRANQNGRSLKMKGDKSYTASIPMKKIKDDMKFYTGKMEDSELTWENPVDLLEESPVSTDRAEEGDVLMGKNSPVSIYENGAGLNWPGNRERNKAGKIIEGISWDRRNERIHSFSIQEKNESEVTLVREDYTIVVGMKAGLDRVQALKLKEWFKRKTVLEPKEVAKQFNTKTWSALRQRDEDALQGFDISSQPKRVGVNFGGIDKEMATAFRSKNLGWANIDRLINRGVPLILEVDVAGISADSYADISMVVPSYNCFIPGFKKKNGHYSFTHGDFENSARMPVGVKAYVVCSSEESDGYKFNVHEFKIGDKTVETITLAAANKAEALKRVQKMF